MCISVGNDADRDLCGRAAGLPVGGAGSLSHTGEDQHDPAYLFCVMIGHGNAVKA